MSQTKPVRILHVVGSMNRGGVETWLMHVLRNIDRTRLRMDFLVHSSEPAAYDEEILSLGSRLIRCGVPSIGFRYPQCFWYMLRRYGPYDVVHSHVHHFSGVTLSIAKAGGVPIRIAHSHNDTSGMDKHANAVRDLYLRFTRSAIDRAATLKIAASNEAGASLFGESWQNDQRSRIHYCAIDLSSFFDTSNRCEMRRELQIAEDIFVVGHVGRFDLQKNHRFILEVATRTVAVSRAVLFLLVGDGPLRSEFERSVRTAGLAEHVILTGSRSDVPKLMTGVMDMFILPSLYEGLPVVGIEAQAAGLQCLFSDNITREVGILGNLSQFLPIGSAEVWANQIVDMSQSSNVSGNAVAVEALRSSPFNIKNGVRELERMYAASGE